MLQFNNIHKTFNPNTEARNCVYRGLNLNVDEGEFIVIVGSNGSGKSTLLNMIGGNVLPDQGTIQFKDENIMKIKPYKRFRVFSRVFQDPSMGTSPSLTVFENLAMAVQKGNLLNLKGLKKHADSSEFVEGLSELGMGLEHKMDIKVGHLSGGQRQALSLLMSLINEPEVLLLDEHTAALDPKSSERIMQITNDMVTKRHITTLMVTHNINHALTYGTRLIMFHEGEIVCDVRGEEKQNLTQERIIELFRQHEPSILSTI
ncbi:ABC transporter ATP-binding protein [Erysipelothrix larvae]|uniref:ABC transporter ATP-binding protein n=1 Tax=Erysipelothrix larvae TaxID=1514105 RepID=A0A0X8H1D2_9FIRM|nr:ATP-binding cassette domain-containing protein [Erysipelothrix larvae]AMC94283.1 ABC transporter ATP-binding protein [Erysipelothrix larvae]